MNTPKIRREVHEAIDAEFARNVGELSRLTGDRGVAASALNRAANRAVQSAVFDEDDPERLAARLLQVATVAAAWADRLMVPGWIHDRANGEDIPVRIDPSLPVDTFRLEPTERRCPDDGKCHHGCATGCFRVSTCVPLGGVFPGDRWPDEVRRAHSETDGHL